MKFLENLNNLLSEEFINEAVSRNDLIIIDVNNYDPEIPTDPYGKERKPPEEQEDNTYLTITALERALSYGNAGALGAESNVNWSYTDIPGYEEYMKLPQKYRKYVSNAHNMGHDADDIAAMLGKKIGVEIDPQFIENMFASGPIMTPWEFFMDWFSDLLVQNGLEPYPLRGFDDDADFDSKENILGSEVPRTVGGKETPRKIGGKKVKWDAPSDLDFTRGEVVTSKTDDDPRADVRRQLVIIVNKLADNNPDSVDTLIEIMEESPDKPEWLTITKGNIFTKDERLEEESPYRIHIGTNIDEPGFDVDPEEWENIRRTLAAKHSEQAKLRSQKAGATMRAQHAEAYDKNFVELYKKIVDDAVTYPENAGKPVERIQMALNKYIAALIGSSNEIIDLSSDDIRSIRDLEFSPEDFNELPNKLKAKINRRLSRTDYLHIRDLLESYNLWATAIFENDDKLLTISYMFIEDAIDNVVPLPSNDVEESLVEYIINRNNHLLNEENDADNKRLIKSILPDLHYDDLRFIYNVVDSSLMESIMDDMSIDFISIIQNSKSGSIVNKRFWEMI